MRYHALAYHRDEGEGRFISTTNHPKDLTAFRFKVFHESTIHHCELLNITYQYYHWLINNSIKKHFSKSTFSCAVFSERLESMMMMNRH
jgi:hypothetical protein